MVDNKTSFDMIRTDQAVYLKYVQVLVFHYFLKVVFKKNRFYRAVGVTETKFKLNSKYNGELLMGSKQRKGMIRFNI